jgi:hypothetical protein
MGSFEKFMEMVGSCEEKYLNRKYHNKNSYKLKLPSIHHHTIDHHDTFSTRSKKLPNFENLKLRDTGREVVTKSIETTTKSMTRMPPSTNKSD